MRNSKRVLHAILYILCLSCALFSCKKKDSTDITGKWVHSDVMYDEIWTFGANNEMSYIFASNNELPTLYTGSYRCEENVLHIKIMYVSGDSDSSLSNTGNEISFDLVIDEDRRFIDINGIHYQREDFDISKASLVGKWSDESADYSYYSEFEFTNSEYTERFYENGAVQYIYSGSYTLKDKILNLRLEKYSEDAGKTWEDVQPSDSVYDFYMFSSDKFTISFYMNDRAITSTYMLSDVD